jgi:carbamoyl-phosphate synthase small subunit
MQAILALEDGRIFRGHGYGAPGECQGEVVFNTSLTGYQEIATDPSYAGQIVVLTNPQIGNYGTNQADNESARPYIEGLIVREFSPISSNWRSEQVTDEYMERYAVPVLAEIDTRALVRHLRTHGVMRGVISTVESDPDALVQKARWPAWYRPRQFTTLIPPTAGTSRATHCFPMLLSKARENANSTWSRTISASNKTF